MQNINNLNNSLWHYDYQLSSTTKLSANEPTPQSQAPASSDKVTLSSHKTAEPSLTYSANGKIRDEMFNTGKAEDNGMSHNMKQLMQAMLDQRIGFDREKWDELQEKIDAIMSIENPTDTDMAQLEALQKEQQALLDKTAEKLKEDAESQASLGKI